MPHFRDASEDKYSLKSSGATFVQLECECDASEWMDGCRVHTVAGDMRHDGFHRFERITRPSYKVPTNMAFLLAQTAFLSHADGVAYKRRSSLPPYLCLM